MITQALNPKAPHAARTNVANLSANQLLLLSVSVSSQVPVHPRPADVVAGARAVAVGVGVPVHIALPVLALALLNVGPRSNRPSRPHLRQEPSKLSDLGRNQAHGLEKKESAC